LRISVDDLDADPAPVRFDGEMHDERGFPGSAFLGHDCQRPHALLLV
jgi:hypothetical protein